MYYLVYKNGACQTASEVDISQIASMIHAGVLLMAIDTDKNRCLINNVGPEGVSIGWATPPGFGDFPEEQIELLE